MKHCDTCRSTYPTEYSTCPKDGTPLRVMSELTSGTVIRGKYEIVERIGAGGMATVYKAKHLAFHEVVALKIVSSKLMDDGAFLKRFKTEAVVTRKLQHPNAVRVQDFDTLEDGRPFMALEFVAGKSLRAVLVESGALPAARAISIAQQIAGALGEAHGFGITHRDIKPDNVLLIPQPDGTDMVKVLDFGIAKVREGVLDQGQGYTATQTGLVVGTPQYLSPEQAMGKHGDAVDGRADIYALGIVLYEMLAGELPFRGDTAIALLLHHMNTLPIPVHQLKPDLGIPAPLSAVLMKSLEKDPAQRYQTAEDFRAALAEVESSIPTATVVIGSGAVTTLVTSERAAPTIEVAKAATMTVAPETAAWPAAHSKTSVTPVPPADKSVSALPSPTKPPGPTSAPFAKVAAAPKTPARFTVTAAKRPTVKPGEPKSRHLVQWVVLSVSLLLLLGAWGLFNKQHERTAETAAPAVDADQRILTEVQHVISRSEKLAGDTLSVQVQGKVVTLDGTVRSKEELDIAKALAEGVEGVVAVQDHLKVPGLKPAAAQAKKPGFRTKQQPVSPSAAVAPKVASSEPAKDAGVQEKKKEFVQAMLQEARQHMRQGQYAQALGLFNRVLAVAPNNAWAQEGKMRAEKRLAQPDGQPGRQFRRR